MTDLTVFGANLAAEALLGTGTYYISLHTGDPGSTGAANELAAANGYARQPTTFTITANVAESDDALDFGPAAVALGTVTHFAVWNNAAGGNAIAGRPLADERIWSSGALEAAAGAFTLTTA